MAMLIAWAAFARCLYVSPALILAVGILAIAVVVTPKMALGSDFADTRLVPIALLIGIASLDFRPAPKSMRRSTFSPQLNRAVVATVLGLVIARCVTQTWIWTDWAQKIETIVDGYAVIEPGSTVFAVVVGPSTRLAPKNADGAAAWRPPVKHVASYAALHGPIFVPMTWTDPLKQPLALKERFKSIKSAQGNNPKLVNSADELSQYVERLITQGQSEKWVLTDSVYVSVISSAMRPINWQPPPGTSVVSRGLGFLLLQLDDDFFCTRVT